MRGSRRASSCAPSGRRIDQPRSATASVRSRPNRRPSRAGGRAGQRLARRPAERGVEGVGEAVGLGRGRLLDQERLRPRDLARTAPGPRTGATSTPAASGSRSWASQSQARSADGPVGEPPRGLGAERGEVAGQLGREPLAVARPPRQARLAARGFAWTTVPSSRRNSSDRPSSTNRSPGLQPLGVGAFERADLATPSARTRHRFLRRDRPDVAPEPADDPTAPDAEPPPRFQIRGAVHFGAAPGSGSKAPPARRGRRRGSRGRRRNRSRDRLGHRPGLADQGERLVGRPLAAAGHADQLLAEDVERALDRSAAARPARRSRPPGRDDRAGQLGGRGGEQEPARRRTRPVPGPADPLQAPRRAAGQADLDGRGRPSRCRRPAPGSCS